MAVLLSQRKTAAVMKGCGNAELIWQASDGTGLIKLPAGTDARLVLGVEVVKA
jgi:hypothetical protein